MQTVGGETVSRRHFDPREWQPLGIDHVMDHERCALWADMGMGKGVMTYTALSNLEITEDVFPALALGPKRVARDVWPKECDKWEHLKHLHCVSLVGDADHRNRAIRYDSPVYSINYENLPWLVQYWGDAWPYKTVIADESRKLHGHRGGYRTSKTGKEYLQAAGGVRTKALAEVAFKSRRFIELTGKPAPQGYQDLWGQLWFLDRGQRLGRTFDGFTKRWFRQAYNGFGLDVLDHAKSEINERIKDLCLTIDPRDYLDLREPIVNNVMIDLPPQAMKIYRDMEKKMFAEMEGRTVEAFNSAAKTQKCLQLANGAVYVDPLANGDEDPRAKEWRAVHDQKLEALDSILEENSEANVMVAYTFRSDLARLLKRYPGSMDLSHQAGEKAFKAGKVRIGICHPASLGHGVDDLQNVCNTIIHFGHDWSLDNYDQLNGRVGAVRQLQAGFDRPTYVHHILARGTLDEEVMERRKTNRSTQDILLEAAKRRKYT